MAQTEFGYAPDPMKLKERLNKLQSGKSGYLTTMVDMYKAQVGLNVVRILPPTWPGATSYGFDISVHYSVGPDRKHYICNRLQYEERCPICDERKRAQDEGADEYAKDLAPQTRTNVWIVNRKEQGSGPMLWAIPQTIEKELIYSMVDPVTGELLADITNWDNGFDVQFRREGTGQQNTKYLGVKLAQKPSVAGSKEHKQYIKDHAIPSLCVHMTYEEVQKSVFGVGVGQRPSQPKQQEPQQFQEDEVPFDMPSQEDSAVEGAKEEASFKMPKSREVLLSLNQEEQIKVLEVMLDKGMDIDLVDEDTQESILAKMEEALFGKREDAGQSGKQSAIDRYKAKLGKTK